MKLEAGRSLHTLIWIAAALFGAYRLILHGCVTLGLLPHKLAWETYLYVFCRDTLVPPCLVIFLVCPVTSICVLLAGTLASFFLGQMSGFTHGSLEAARDSAPLLLIALALLASLSRSKQDGIAKVPTTVRVALSVVAALVAFAIGLPLGAVWGSFFELLLGNSLTYMFAFFATVFCVAVGMAMMAAWIVYKRFPG